MQRDEVEGVLAHEVSHIANGDMVTMTLIQGVVNAFVMFFARVIASIAAQRRDERSRRAVDMMTASCCRSSSACSGSVVVAGSRARASSAPTPARRRSPAATR